MKEPQACKPWLLPTAKGLISFYIKEIIMAPSLIVKSTSHVNSNFLAVLPIYLYQQIPAFFQLPVLESSLRNIFVFEGWCLLYT